MFDPPLRVKLEGIPPHEVEAHVHEMVAKHYEEVVVKAQPSSSS